MKREIVLDKVCIAMNLTSDEVLKKSREPKLVNARIIYSVLCRSFTKSTVIEIGNLIKRNHSSVSHYFKVFRNYIDTDKYFKEYHDLSRRLVIQHIAKSYAEEVETDMLQQIDNQIKKLLEVKKRFSTIEKAENI